MRYTTVLFDADDTLLDFKGAEYCALGEVLRALRLPDTDEYIAAYSEINDSLWKLLEVGGIKKDELKVKRFSLFCDRFGFDVNAEEMAEMYVEALSNQSMLLDGAEELVKRLYGKCELYLITNGIEYIQTKRLENTPIKQCFKKVFISERMGAEKPSLKYFEAVAKEISELDKSQAIVIGDSLTSDIKGGINFGVDTCWYNPKGKKRPENMDITYVVGTFDEIYEVVAGE